MRLLSRNRVNKHQLIMAHKRVISTLKSDHISISYDPKLSYHCDKKKEGKIWRYHFFIVPLSLKIVNITDILPMNANVIDNIRQYFSTQPVRKAWLFGSFSRGEETAQSDVDILVEFD